MLRWLRDPQRLIANHVVTVGDDEGRRLPPYDSGKS
jgi:hypothetical protein